MKASVKIRRDPQGPVHLKKPIVKVKLPFEFLGFPVQAGLKVCGHIQELALRLAAHQEAGGPSLQLSMRPHGQDRSFVVSLRTGFSPWPSSPASSLTMTAEFNISRLSNPTFLLRVRPQVGDFSLRYDFHSEIGRSNGSPVDGHVSTPEPQVNDATPSDIDFTNAFARYAPPLSHFAENSGSSWHDPVKNGCDGPCNANFASYDSTPHSLVNAGFPRFDVLQCSLEHPRTVSQVLNNEKSYQNSYHGWRTDMDWGPLNGRSQSYSQKTHRVDDGWDRVGDAISGSTATTSASSSVQQRRDGHHKPRLHGHSQSYSTSSLSGWGACGNLLEGSQLRACTHLPISSEAHLKLRWSVGACCLSSRAPLVPILLLDKVSLEANAPCAGSYTTSPSTTMALSKFLQRAEGQGELHDEDMQMERGIRKKAREDRRPDDTTHYTIMDSKSTSTMEDLHASMNTVTGKKKMMKKKNSFLGQFLQWKGALD